MLSLVYHPARPGRVRREEDIPTSTASFTTDLHVHSRLSGDNDADPEACIVRAIERGLDGIAFTEHYSYEASEPVEPLAERYRGRILVLRGVEFSAAEGHCLVFGVDTDRLVAPYDPVALLIREVNRAGGAVIPSHPYRAGGTGVGDLILTCAGIVAVEGYNGCNLARHNRLAVEAARGRGLFTTGGSDAHRPEDVGSCYTRFPGRVTRENLVGLLRAGGYHGEESDERKKYSRGPGGGGPDP